jgi:hypothetical protein
MTEVPKSTTKKKADAIGAKATAKLGGGPTARRTGRGGGTTKRMTTNYGTTSQSQNRENADIEFDEVRAEYRNMKPEPLYVFRDRRAERDEDDPDAENESRPPSSQKREGEESKDQSQAAKGGKEGMSIDQGLSDSKSLMGDSEDEEAKRKEEEKRNEKKKKGQLTESDLN